MLDDHFPEPEPEDPFRIDTVYNVSVTIHTVDQDADYASIGGGEADSEPATRSVSGYDTVRNSWSDSYVDPTKITILFTQGTASKDKIGKYIGSFRARSVVRHTDDSSYYTVSGPADTIPTEQHWGMAAVVNVSNFDLAGFEEKYKATSAALKASSGWEDFAPDVYLVNYGLFYWEPGSRPSASNPIPMYGIYRYKGANSDDTPYKTLMDEKKYVDFTAYHAPVIRAVAKIIVRCNEGLTDLKLTRCNTYGMAIPLKVLCTNSNNSGTFSNTVSVCTASNMNLPHERIDTYDNGVEENVPFSVLKDGTKRTLSYAGNYILYTPEYRNVETSGVEVEHTALTFTLKGQEYTVPFGEYDEAGKWNGTYLDIIRNYCYQFIITTSPNGPKVNYVVLPWEEETAGDIIFD
jgi:hypothetical protein